MPEPKKTDPHAPPSLTLAFKTPDGKEWGEVVAVAKQFSSGSVGFFANGKVTNPDGGERYQVGVNIVLIGSKP